ncbi:type II toxin-antitoxin system PemK/MazF family toxin [Hydrogenothermus marinus]|uniref:mRNA interferase MazF n=1 Tax=Hydrogenothermus marinus TaxID=133270 RepID=A0A3M0BGC9_9AQUI|nr:type II toxin-antitoxin system PemK/MazF family toxin [Hydrogenothermus marinus]RMA96191.1 mRNA interferase MazF [Hydrogenothermus marinus]
MVIYIPKKGDIIHLNFNPSIGHEQKGNRYVVVVSHYIFNKNTGMCFAIPITSKYKGYPTEKYIEIGNIKGYALIDQLKSIDYKARNIKFKAKLPEEQLEEILDIIETIIFS